jgi:glycosyltransferase involved in cell wall biosynthesis
MTHPVRYKVSAILSTYNSEPYFRACIENLIGQSLYRREQLEIIIINSGSEQGEDALARGLLAERPHIVYQRTERETLYAAWNRGIGLSRGKYIVNTNTDDTLRDDALELLAASLEAHPSADLAFANCAWTHVPNDSFADSHAFRCVDYPPFDPALGMLCCLLGPHPMWRATVFARIGRFDPRFTAAGDYEFQMRFIHAGCSAVHVPEVLSLFFQNPDGLTLASERSDQEARQIEGRYRESIPIERLYAVDGRDPLAAAQAWVAQGNLALDWKCPWLDKGPPLPEYALACYRRALSLDPANPSALRNLCALSARYGKWDSCRHLLDRFVSRDTDLRTRIQNKIPPAFAPVSAPPAVAPWIYSPGRLEGGLTRGDAGAPAATTGRLSSPQPLKVLYDISVLGLGAIYESARTGIYRVVEHVVEGLASSAGIRLSFCATQAKSERSPETIGGCRKYLAGHPEFRDIPFHEPGTGYPPFDIFHSPFHALPRDVDAPIRFLTVYDLIPILYPQFIPARVTQLQKMTFAQRKANDRYFCISHATRSDLRRVIGIEPEHATVTHLAADSRLFHPCSEEAKLAAVRAKYGIGEGDYILSLCTLEPRKNIDHVIRAFARWVRSGNNAAARLVLVGTRGWDYQRIFNEIDNDTDLRARIVLTGYVDDQDLSALYSGACLFVYMSLYEGFGLPPLEAMQCGTPVIVSNTSSLPEVVGDAGILLDPHDLDGLCLAMNEVVDNSELRAEMSRRALQQASRFSWESCVVQTIAAYRAALAATC